MSIDIYIYAFYNKNFTFCSGRVSWTPPVSVETFIAIKFSAETGCVQPKRPEQNPRSTAPASSTLPITPSMWFEQFMCFRIHTRYVHCHWILIKQLHKVLIFKVFSAFLLCLYTRFSFILCRARFNQHCLSCFEVNLITQQWMYIVFILSLFYLEEYR